MHKKALISPQATINSLSDKKNELYYTANVKKTFILLLLSHIFVDFFMGIWPIYKTMAGIDIAKAGLIMGLAIFIAEIMQIGFGFLSDNGHRKKVILCGLLGSSAALFYTFSSSLYGVLALLLCAMMGSSSFHPAAVGIAGQITHTKRNPVLLFAAAGALGLATSQIVFINTYNFFGGIYPLFIPLLLISIYWLFHKVPEQESVSRFSIREFFSPFAKQKRPLLLLYIIQALSYGILLSVIFMLPDILRSKGYSNWLVWGGGHMCFIFGSMIGMLLFSAFSERLGHRNILIGAIISSIVFLNIFLFSSFTNEIIVIQFLSVLGASLYLLNPIILSWGNKLVPESPSTVSGLLMGLAWALSSFFPPLSGFLASIIENTPHVMAISIVSLFFFPCLFCALLLPRPVRVYN